IPKEHHHVAAADSPAWLAGAHAGAAYPVPPTVSTSLHLPGDVGPGVLMEGGRDPVQLSRRTRRRGGPVAVPEMTPPVSCTWPRVPCLRAILWTRQARYPTSRAHTRSDIMTINVNGANATGLVVQGGTVIGTQNNPSYYYSRPLFILPLFRR